MKVIIKEFPKDWKKMYILPISDIHYGNSFCDIDKLKRYLNWAMEQENVYFLLNGDLVECAIKESVGNVYQQKISPQEQLDFMKEFWSNYKERIIGITAGNHEMRIYKEVGIDITKELAAYLQVPYEREGLIVKIHVGSDKNRKSRQVPYLIYMTHGWSNARTSGAKLNSMESLSSIIINADIYISSHTHKLISSPEIVFYIDDKNNAVVEKKRYYVSSGSYLRYGDYAQMKGLRPVKLGTARIRLDGTRKDVHISI